jgi:hypothetical protein
VPGPLETMQGTLDVSEERLAARPGAYPDPAGLDRLRYLSTPLATRAEP